MSQNQEMMATQLGLFNGKTKNFPSFKDLLSETCNVEEIIPEIRVQYLELIKLATDLHDRCGIKWIRCEHLSFVDE